MAIVQFRVDDKLKQDATELFENLGLDLSTALRMFLKRSVDQQGIPFPMLLGEVPPPATRALEVMRRAQLIAQENGNDKLTLDEINEIIRLTREERKNKKQMKSVYAVIDTNVVVSSFLKIGSIPNEVVSLALDGAIVPILNKEILAEYKEVLMRNMFGLTEEEVDDFIDNISKRGVFLDRTATDEIFTDAGDIVFYEVVMTAREKEDAYLVTGNKRHFPLKPFVVTPREMLEIVKALNVNA